MVSVMSSKYFDIMIPCDNVLVFPKILKSHIEIAT